MNIAINTDHLIREDRDSYRGNGHQQIEEQLDNIGGGKQGEPAAALAVVEFAGNLFGAGLVLYGLLRACGWRRICYWIVPAVGSRLSMVAQLSFLGGRWPWEWQLQQCKDQDHRKDSEQGHGVVAYHAAFRSLNLADTALELTKAHVLAALDYAAMAVTAEEVRAVK